MRESVASFLLPDRCRIYPPDRQITSSGSYREGLGQPLQYNGSPDIPCRLDESKHYRQAEVFDQEAIVSEFELHVSWDAPLSHDYKIEINGLFYEVRKMADVGEFLVTKSALVARIGQGTTS
jgi:hypothetical protein